MIFVEDDIGAADSQDVLNLERLNEKLKDHPCDFDTLLRKALLLSCPFYRSDKASIVFDLLISLYPNSYEVYFWYGQSEYVYVADYEKAARLLRKAMEINPNRAEAYILCAEVLDCLGENKEEVESFYKKAEVIEPYWPKSWYGLIYLLKKQKRFDEAREVIQKALRCIPKNFIDSNDLIQGRHDWIVSGRDWTCHMEKDLLQYLQDIDEQEAKENNGNEGSL